MKKLVVSRECAACGLCFGCFDFLKEGNDGKAVVENNGILPANVTMNKLQEVINNCPVNALKVENFEYVKSSGTKGVKELLGIMRKPLDYKLPSADFYKFNNVEIPIPYSPNEHRYIYKSYDSAVSAGLDEFNRIMYSQRVALIQQVVIKYKNDILLPYVRLENKKGNYYYGAINEAITKMKAYVAEIEEKTGRKLALPKNFYDFKVREGKSQKDMFKLFETYAIDQGWASSIADGLDSLSEYRTWVDVDDTTEYVRKSHWFGDDTYEEEDRYCFKLRDVCRELAKDINFQCHLELDTMAENLVNGSVKYFFGELNKEWSEKVKLVENLIGKI